MRYILVTDGSSDACLLHPIRWLMASMGWVEVEGQWADLRVVPDVGRGLVARLRTALNHYSGELLFIHRDAEADPLEHRLEEIRAAISTLGSSIPHVCVVPVRMTEAWLIHDEAAIRTASGKPRGNARLNLPPIKKIEELANPKSTLRDALLTASEATGRIRKRKLRDFGSMRSRVAELIEDYAPLRALKAFDHFERELRGILESM
ncbi:MAG: hypothetical protein AAGF11_07730 [Myxococcota bacterium]